VQSVLSSQTPVVLPKHEHPMVGIRIDGEGEDLMITHMHGIVLCAGLGTRLRPLTQVLPKPAVPVGDLPSALRNAEQLLDAGFRSIHVNTHYLADEFMAQIRAAARSRGWPEEAVRFWHEPELLETGGGIARIIHEQSRTLGHSQFWDALVVSGDIVAEIPLSLMIQRWSMRAANETSLMASLPLNTPRKDVTWVSADSGSVVGFGADISPETAQSQSLQARIFSNHQIVSGAALQRSEVKKSSSIDLFYRESLRRGERIAHVPLAADAQWYDIGSPVAYMQCLSTLNVPSGWMKSLTNLDVFLENSLTATADASLLTPTHDQACADRRPHGQAGSINPNLGDWIWLGHLHACPELLRPAILRLLNRFESSEVKSEALSFKKICSDFLMDQTGRRRPPRAHLPASPQTAPCLNGFFDVSFTDATLEKRKWPHPILVRLTTLLEIPAPDSGDSSHHFWLLIRPQGQFP
jgi:mannose-1-phosphate guanylyltransferase